MFSYHFIFLIFFCSAITSTFSLKLTKGVLVIRCSENMQHIYRRTPMRKCDFNKVAKQLYWNTLWHGCSPVSLLHIFRTSFLMNTSRGLLLSSWHCDQINFKITYADFISLFLELYTIMILSLLCKQLSNKTNDLFFNSHSC